MKKRMFEVVPLEEAIGKQGEEAAQKICGSFTQKEESPEISTGVLRRTFTSEQKPESEEAQWARPGGEITMDKPQTKRILVVDDEECIAETLVLILRSFGYEATARNDARSALQECELRVPDLVISDVMMPELNGIELAIQIEETYPACRILLISGLGSSFALLEEASQRGHSFEIMSKPIRPADLLAKIRALLADEKLSQSREMPLSTGISLAS